MTTPDPRFENAYRILSGDDSDERACEAIPESACTELPRSYTLNVANGACTKLAEQIAGPNLVLPWLLAAVGAPAVIVGLLMPIKQLFSLVPQLFVSGAIRAVARRKWVWVSAAGVQALCLVLMALAVASLAPLPAGVAVVALLAVFSAASGAGSVAFQDVTGKTVPKGRRGGMLSNRATIGGALTIVAGLVLQTMLGDGAGLTAHLPLLLFAALLWIVAAGLFAVIHEHPGATDGGRNPGRELASGLAFFRRESGFRRFVGVRALMLSIEMAMPFFALYAQALYGPNIATLGVFVLMVGVGNVLSSPVWGRSADRSSRRVLVIAGLVGIAAAGLALLIGALPAPLGTPFVYSLVFVLLGIAEQGVRLGRKTYLVDAAPGDERPLLVAFSNTGVGLLALLAGLLGWLAQGTSASVAVLAIGVLSAVAAIAAWHMPEADAMMGTAE